MLARDVGQPVAGVRHEGAARLGARHYKLCVVARLEDLFQIRVALLHVGNAGFGKPVWRAFPMLSERVLRRSQRLPRMLDALDARPGQRSAVT